MHQGLSRQTPARSVSPGDTDPRGDGSQGSTSSLPRPALALAPTSLQTPMAKRLVAATAFFSPPGLGVTECKYIPSCFLTLDGGQTSKRNILQSYYR